MLATVAGSLVFTSCKKDSDDPKPKSKAELITAKNWRVSADVSTEVGSNGQTVTTDGYAKYQACEKDDYVKFNSDKTLKSNQGTNRCNSSDPQEETGSWDFNSDQTKLTLVNPNFGGLAIQLDLVELTATTLKTKISSGSGSTLETQTITFTAF